ncbi:helix-turn-helix transcriptional regulator [Oscillospiraceae bacterium HV4-5-C5C]|nr:helix-turn-helix transcriptional regulator [Oscillospiraceae bacterium HV4-5-C5C]
MERESSSSILTECNQKQVSYAVVQKKSCEIPNFVSRTFRILRFVEGSVDWRIGEELYRFQAGDVVVLNNLIKRNIERVYSTQVIYERFDFSPSLLTQEALRSFYYSQTYRIQADSSESAQQINFLLDLLQQEIHQQEAAFAQLAVQRLLELLTLLFYRLSPHPQPIVQSALPTLSRITQYMQDHFREDIRIQDLACRCGYTPEYLSRIFHQYIGLSPKSYLINLRMEAALNIAMSQDMGLLDAALQSGFHSSSAFYKTFRAYHGMTPGQYLKGLNNPPPA